MKTLLFLIVSATIITSFTNTATPSNYRISYNDTLPAVDSIFEVVEVEATFPGGQPAWRQFLETNLNADVPAKKKAPVGTYTVVVQFIVDKNGKISNISAITNHGHGMEQEVVRVIKRSLRWLPAVQNGRPVKAYRKQPVTFAVTG